MASGSIIPRKQENSQATFAPVLRKEDGMIEWTRTAPEIYNRVRGFLPWPGCYTRFRGRLLQIWKARVAENFTPGEPGAVQPGKSRLVVNCGGATALEVLEVQPEGKRRMPAVAFLSGYHLVHNESLGVV